MSILFTYLLVIKTSCKALLFKPRKGKYKESDICLNLETFAKEKTNQLDGICSRFNVFLDEMVLLPK